MNIDSELKKFREFSQEQKRELCLTILGQAKNLGGLFLELYTLVDSDKATEKDYLDIYESAMIVLYESEIEKVQASVNRLEQVRIDIKKSQEQERQERIEESEKASLNLSTLL